MMKKLLFPLLLFWSLSAFAQIDPLDRIPADPDVRHGRLDNGLTYYIRHNPLPANQADFYIYHDVGAVQEEDSQDGLAHFLEHMAFNGTKNLPGKMLTEYLETIGVKFGANLNAFTGKEMTAYFMSNVPLYREGIIDTALLVLHDWSYFIALEADEIDAERGVIVEELRTRNTADWRVREKTDKVLYGDTRYANRNIIGTIDGLRTFDHQELRDFYHRWYRTDLQAIVIVGDIDAEEIERKLIGLMADIPPVENPEVKEPFPLPYNDEPVIGIAGDPELSRSSVAIYFKREPMPREMNDFIPFYNLRNMVSMISRMMNYRFADIQQQPDAPFVGAQSYDRSLTATADAFMLSAIAHENKSLEAFDALYREYLRVKRYGFTESELDRARSEMLREAEKAWDASGDRRNEQFPWIYINNFRNNYPMPSAEVQWELDSTFYSNVEIGVVNMIAWQLMTDQNQVIIITSPEKEGISIPDQTDIMASIQKIGSEDIEPIEDAQIEGDLIEEELPGSPVSNLESDAFDSKVITLANGLRIITRQSDYKRDEVLMQVHSDVGLALLEDKDYIARDMLTTFFRYAGVGNFSATELQRMTAGKYATFNPYLNSYSHGFRGTASSKDTETMFELLYLYFTQPRFVEDDLISIKQRFSSILANLSTNPDYIFYDSINMTLYDHNPRRERITVEALNEFTLSQMERIYHSLYGNPADFTFIITGDFDYDELLKLIETYVGSLPVYDKKLSPVDDGIRPVKGQVTNRFTTPMETPKTSVYYAYTGAAEYTLAEELYMEVLSQILRIRYTESIREEMGATYGVGVGGSLDTRPVGNYKLGIQFDTDAELADAAMEVIGLEIEKIAAYGPKEEDMGKVREYMIKSIAEENRKNNTWLEYLTEYFVEGIDKFTDYERLVRSMTSEDIRLVAQRILSDGNIARVIMDPR